MTKKLKASYIILTRIKNELENARIGIDYLKEQKISAYRSDTSIEDIHKINTALYGLIHFSFIRYVAFLDEFTIYFKSKNEVEQTGVNRIKAKAELHLSEVADTFGAVKIARNRVLAHGYRKGKKALSNSEINSLFNQLISFNDLDPFYKLPDNTAAIVKLIAEELGELDENDVSLSVPESVDE